MGLVIAMVSCYKAVIHFVVTVFVANKLSLLNFLSCGILFLVIIAIIVWGEPTGDD